MRQETWTKILFDLIRIDTSVPPGNYERAIDYLAPRFEEVGCEVARIAVPRNLTKGFKTQRINLLAHRRRAGKPRLLIYTHIDTVGVRSWRGFTPRVEDGKIYGRGSADMKGAIVGLLWGLDKVKKKTLNWDVTAMVTTDEEMLGKQAPQLEYLGQFLEPLRGAYIWDLDSLAGQITIAGLGAIQMEIEIKGKSAHAALSHLGVNAIEKARLLMNALFGLKEKVEQRKSNIAVHPDTGIERMESRLNITIIKGGFKVNIIPDVCRVSLDRRLIPEENLEEAERELIDCISTASRNHWKIRKTLKIPTSAIDPEDPIVCLIARVFEGVARQPAGKYGGMGSFDLSGVADKWGAKVFSLGVFRPESNIHGRNEFVYIKDIEDLSEVAAQFLLKD